MLATTSSALSGEQQHARLAAYSGCTYNRKDLDGFGAASTTLQPQRVQSSTRCFYSLLAKWGLAKCMPCANIDGITQACPGQLLIDCRDRKAGLDAPAAFMNLLAPDAMVSPVGMHCRPAALPHSHWLMPTVGRLHAHSQGVKALLSQQLIGR
jgi:hypothetical protein